MASDKVTLDDLRIDRSSDVESGTGRRVWIWVVLGVLVLAGAGGWWLSRPKAAPVKVAVAQEKAEGGAAPAGAVLNASGYVTARRQATVSSKITGKVVDVLVEEGMEIREGQILARLDDSITRKELTLSEARLSSQRRSLTETEVRLKEARLNQGRMKRLLDQGVTTRSQLDTADAEVDSLAARLAVGREEIKVAESEVALRRQDLDDTVIRAPFSGVAISKDAQPGEMISPVSAGGGFTRTGICTLVDMSSLEIEVDVNESYIQRVRTGQKAVATLDAYPEWQIPSRVIMPVPTADRQKATVRVRLGFDALDPRILPDMGVKVAFLGDEPPAAAAASQRVVVIPRTAVRKDGEKDVVFVVREDKAERRAVGISPAPGNEAVVLSGLASGERVIVEGPPDLKDGDAVAVREQGE